MKNNHRFAFHSPLIVLIILPAVMIAFFFLQNEWITLNTVHILFPSKGDSFLNERLEEQMRSYKTYHLTNDRHHNGSVLVQIRRDLNKLKSRKDKFNGIHIHIDDAAPFQAFITCFDICIEKKPGVFVNYGNDIYTMYFATGRESDQLSCQ